VVRLKNRLIRCIASITKAPDVTPSSVCILGTMESVYKDVEIKVVVTLKVGKLNIDVFCLWIS